MKSFELLQIELPDQLKIIDFVAKGGAGNILRVQDITGKILALKMVYPSWHEKEFLSLTALRNLPVHPSLTQVFQVGTLSDGRLFYTMEIADNISPTPDSDYLPDTLANRINSEKLSFESILEIFIDIADGIRHLHNNNLGHGDIKPENIIFINGHPKLADFGTLVTDKNTGTAGFMLESSSSIADRDCYALSKTLYCTWSGKDVSEYPSLPEKFDYQEAKLIRKIYHRGCSSIARRRFASAEEFIAHLKKIRDELHYPLQRKIFIAAAFLFFLAIASIVIICHTNRKSPLSVPQKINHSEIALMQNVLQAGKVMPDDLNGIRPFRKVFESLSEEDLDKLDSEKVKWFRNFYKDKDRLSDLYLQIIAEKNSHKQLTLYKTTKYKELLESVYARRMAFDHKFVHTVFKLKLN